MSGAAVRLAAALSVAGAVHAAVNAVLLRRPPTVPPRVRRPVTVVVPARDEEARIGSCLTAILAQRGVADLRLVVVDDGSTDRTAAVVSAIDDPRLRLVTAGPLPAGWLGKAHACALGAAHGAGADGVLAFVDADVDLEPDALAASVAVLDAAGLDLVCPWPRPVAETLAERLVQPLSPWLWATTLPLRLAEHSGRPSLAAANGQFLVVTRQAYDRAGGHAAVRSEVLEDIALLRAVKRAGGRGGPIAGARLASCRMYDGWPALREGYAKSLWASVGGSPGATVAAAAALTGLGVVPAVAALRGSRAGLVGYAAAVASRMVSAAATGSRAWPDPVAHPLSLLVLDALLLRSIVGRERGTLTWRGRVLPATTLPDGEPAASTTMER